MSVIHFNSRTRMAPALRHLAITNSKRIDLCPSYHSGLVENSFKPLDPHARKRDLPTDNIQAGEVDFEMVNAAREAIVQSGLILPPPADVA
jgi:hypothetical protein